jgi:hypothetical protein
MKLGQMAVLAGAVALAACAGGDTPRAAATGATSATGATGATGAQNSSTTAAAPVVIDWKAVEAAIGRPGAMQPGDVYRFAFPRGDMHITVAGVAIRPAFALGSWVAFKAESDGAIAMGDFVLSDEELGPVIAKLQAGGVEQSAIHHHLVGETPRVLYVHIHAHGDAVKIATAVHDALALTKTPAASPAPTPTPASAAPFGIDTAQITSILGYSGRVNGGVYQVSVPRAESVRDGGLELPPSMGISTAMNFQPTSGGKAAITGDFVLIASEVNPVIRALTEHGIAVTSLHNHLLADEPRLFFMHFWGVDDANVLARGLRAALDKTNSKGRVP